jgi:protein-S-isoprenylcysteine O-methyltransferase Ste14
MKVPPLPFIRHPIYLRERTLGNSPIATDYDAYRRRAGMFWPRFSSARPGRSTP